MSVLLLVLTALIIGMNGFFVAAEYSLVRSRQNKVEAMVEDGLSGAALLRRQIGDIDEYIATCQVGITMASIGLGALGEPTIANLLEDPLGGVASHGVAVLISGAIAYLVLTVNHVIFGELVPKIYTVVHAETVGRRLARPLEFFARLFKPFSAGLNAAAGAVLRPVGVDPDRAGEGTSGSEDLKFLIARSTVGGTLDPGEADMLQGVFHLHEQEARQVMTPIPAVVTIDISATAEDALRRCVDSGHTRLVVTEEDNTDRIRGIVHIGSLAPPLVNQGPQAPTGGSPKAAAVGAESKPPRHLL